MPTMYDYAAQAEEITNPPDVGWRDLFSSRFIGRLPESAVEVPTAFVVEPTTMTLGSGGQLAASGFFERATNLVLVNIREFSGTLDLVSRNFTFSDQSTINSYTVTGRLCANGRVMYVVLSGEGFATESFPLIHEDTAAEIFPPDDDEP